MQSLLREAVSSISRVQFTIERVERSSKTETKEIIHQRLPIFDKTSLLKFRKTIIFKVFVHQSIPAVPIRPQATAGHLLTSSVPGVVHPQFYRGPGAEHLPTPGDPRAFGTRVLESAMDEFIRKDEAFVEQWLVRQGLKKLADVLKVCFLNFRYFFITVFYAILYYTIFYFRTIFCLSQNNH